MSHEIDMKQYKIRTDLAIDVIKDNNAINNVYKIDDVTINDIIIDEKSSSIIGKKAGEYLTISFDDITDHNNKEKVKKVFVNELKKMIDKNKLNKDDKVLIIGLGNDRSTPDSLGPLSIEKILITEPLFLYGNPEEGFRPVAAFSPGVFGQTGIETGEVIKSIIETYNPKLVIVIDALASQALDRVNHTIQMTDTGISPGSGVGNNRKEISKETVGVPIIAIGVPTVVDAVTIVSDTIDYIYKHFIYTKDNFNNPFNRLVPPGKINYLEKNVQVKEEDKSKIMGLIGTLDEMEIRKLLTEVLSPVGYNLMVTPKEVDFIMEHLSDIIGNGINDALHEKINNL